MVQMKCLEHCRELAKMTNGNFGRWVVHHPVGIQDWGS